MQLKIGGDKITIYDYSRLRGRIVEKFETVERFAHAVGRTRAAVSRKLNNRTYFTQNEIRLFAEKLEIADEEIGQFFFTRK